MGFIADPSKIIKKEAKMEQFDQVLKNYRYGVTFILNPIQENRTPIF